ncbi:hypothetical protein [Streptosporangium longisporum]|uniref:Uncharacterized protein n=1 Tax=Streptosporangium longisporum TaxID=46187 RepID=A0ABP6L457_9ACTN
MTGPPVIVEHLPGKHDQKKHGNWTGKKAGGAPRSQSAAKAEPIKAEDRVQLPDGSTGRVITILPTGQAAVLRDDGSASVHDVGDLAHEKTVSDKERAAAQARAPVRKKATPKHTSVEDWADKGGVIDGGTRTGRGDWRLLNIWKEQGFDGLPRIADEDELDDEVAAGGLEMWRGVGGNSRQDVEAFADQFRTGDEPFPGLGMYGNGTYFAPDAKMAHAFARGGGSKHGAVMRSVLRRDAKVIDYDDLLSRAAAQGDDDVDPRVRDAMSDPGRLAAMFGYDAITVGGQKGAKPREVVVVNRTALSISPQLREPQE